VILLDTNAVLYLLGSHPRADRLAPYAGRLILSPFVLLELRFLEEAGRVRFVGRNPLKAVRADARFRIDEPALLALIERALGLGRIRDPFDRLIAAHALSRGFKLATSDAALIGRLPQAPIVEL
jgi:predicted nucleic acid-binding protein